MKIGDLVKLKTSFHSVMGVVIQGPSQQIMLSGPSLVEHVAVSWSDGITSWHPIGDLEAIK